MTDNLKEPPGIWKLVNIAGNALVAVRKAEEEIARIYDALYGIAVDPDGTDLLHYHFSGGTAHILNKLNIYTMGQLRDYIYDDPEALLKVKGIGVKRRDSIIRDTASYFARLKSEAHSQYPVILHGDIV